MSDPLPVTWSTRTWLSQVRAADPDFDYERLYPVAYEFGKGRVFRDRPNSGVYEQEE